MEDLRQQIAQAIEDSVGESPCWTNFCVAADNIIGLLERGIICFPLPTQDIVTKPPDLKGFDTLCPLHGKHKLFCTDRATELENAARLPVKRQCHACYASYFVRDGHACPESGITIPSASPKVGE